MSDLVGPGLPEPTTEAGRAGLAALLAEPERAVVGLDFDGTLAPIVADPAAARPHPDAAAALARVAAAVDLVAIVTGRPARFVVEAAGMADVPDLVVLGHYGLERWADGVLRAPEPPPGVAAVRRALPALLERVAPGAVVEDKGASLAVHTRRAPDPPGLLAALRAPLAGLAEDNGLVVEPGRFVLELRPPGIDKGAAVRALVDQRPPSCLVFAGDDLGDLAAFDAVDSLRAHGVAGLLVCSGSEEVPELAGRADLVVAGPDGVIELLDAIAAELSRR
jgi:trehalose 6-phosphate phosphatase